MTRARDLADSADKDIVGTLTLDGLDVAGNVSVDGGTIKLDGNYPVGTQNVALGDVALQSGSLTGSGNVAIGRSSLYSNTSGSENTAVGKGSAENNTSGNYLSAIGRHALVYNTTGSSNTAVGHSALLSNTTASNNTAVGYQAGYSNTTGTRMAAFGDGAANANTTANDTVAFGRNALSSNTVGGGNTAVGTNALASNTSDNYNTALGSFALESTTGGRNTAVGYEAGNLITSGSANTILGRFNGNAGGLDIRTSSNNIVLSDGDGNPRGIFDSSGNLLVGKTSVSEQGGLLFQPDGGSQGAGSIIFNRPATSSESFVVVFKDAGINKGYITYTNTGTSYQTLSDYRTKENVVAMTGATDRLKHLNPSRFNFIVDADTTVDGFLAHEVQAVVPEAISGTKDAVDADGNPVYQGIDQSKLVPLLVATIKELEARITALENA